MTTMFQCSSLQCWISAQLLSTALTPIAAVATALVGRGLQPENARFERYGDNTMAVAHERVAARSSAQDRLGINIAGNLGL